MPIAQPFVLFPGNDQTITWGPLIVGSTRSNPTPTYVNDATGTFTLQDANGNDVAGAISLAFSYVAGSNGLYVATILASGFNPAPANMPQGGKGCTSVISLSSVIAAASNTWQIPSIVKLRNES